MSRQPKNATIENIATTDLVTLSYEVPERTVTTPYLVLTNSSNSILDISVYVGSDEYYLIAKDKIPAGLGKTWYVKELSLGKLNAGMNIKLQSETADSFTAFLSVSEISDS